MARLTLNVDVEIVEQAKRLAAERRTSVSAMFSQFIRILADREGRAKPLGKLARQASGVIDLKRRSHKSILGDALRDKYKL
jgi:hypothetical protein